jgi:hypothetical protein
LASHAGVLGDAGAPVVPAVGTHEPAVLAGLALARAVAVADPAIPRSGEGGSLSLAVVERFERGAADVLVDDRGVDVGDLGALGETVDHERV